MGSCYWLMFDIISGNDTLAQPLSLFHQEHDQLHQSESINSCVDRMIVLQCQRYLAFRHTSTKGGSLELLIQGRKPQRKLQMHGSCSRVDPELQKGPAVGTFSHWQTRDFFPALVGLVKQAKCCSNPTPPTPWTRACCGQIRVRALPPKAMRCKFRLCI